MLDRLVGPFLLLLLGLALAWCFRRPPTPALPSGPGPSRILPLSPPTPPPPPDPPPRRPVPPSPSHPSSPPKPRTPGRPDLAYLSGRVLGKEGTPQAGRVFRFTFLRPLSGSPGTKARLVPARTDGKGRFLIPFQPPPPPPDQVVLLLRPMTREGRSLPGLSARLRLLPSYPPGIHFLGDLRLSEPPILASGRVTDLQGHPLAGVEIQPWIQGDTPGPPPSPGKRDPRRRTWTPLPFSARSGPDGTFQVRGDTRAPLLQLRAGGDRWFQDRPLLATPGSRGLALTLLPAGWVEGKVLSPPGVRPANFLLQVYPAAWEGKARTFRQGFPGKEGRFRIGGLPPGQARLVGRMLLDGRKILEIQGLKILPGRPCPDPRLHTLDLLRGKTSLLLTLLDASGRPLREALALAGVHHPRIYRNQGNLFIPKVEPGVPLFLWSPGFLVKELFRPLPGVPRKVRLQPGIPLKVVLDPSLPSPRPPARLELHLSLAPGKTPSSLQRAAALFLGLSGLSSRTRPGEGGSLHFLLPAEGAYTLTWGIAAGRSPSARTFWPGPGERTFSFRVLRASLPSPLVFRPRRSAYMALLKRIEGSYPSPHDEK